MRADIDCNPEAAVRRPVHRRHPRLPLDAAGWRMATWASAFVLLTALGAHIDAPMRPVSMSMQSLGVLAAGAFLGPRWGAAAMLAYLAAGAASLPVFAGGAAGWEHLTGPSAGYLVAFVPAAALAGFAARRGWMDRAGPALLTGLAGHALILGLGTGWLALSIGWTAAADGGLWPFLPGAAAKSALLAALTVAGGRWIARRRDLKI